MKIKFEDEFFPAILDRGYTYYENNLVEDVMKKKKYLLCESVRT